MKKFQKVLFLFAGICIVFAGIPLVYGEFDIGGTLLLVLAAAALAFPFLWKQQGVIRKVSVFLYSFGLAVFIFLSGSMLYTAYGKQPPIEGRQTVIVLGARVVGNRPSLMLARRLNIAATYLHANPEATCIVTGGQGADEIYPEAEVMKNYLVEKGIDPQRIIEEDQAVNTRQNIRLSQPLIPENSEGVVIITDNFHQKRASITAGTVGMTPVYHLSSMPPVELLPQYWLRDLPGIPLTWLEERILEADEEIITRHSLGGET